MIVSVVDVTERKRVESVQQLASEERVEWFERLVAELSATFINVPSEQVDGIIEERNDRSSRRSISMFGGCWVAKDDDLWYTHDWTRPGFPTQSSFPDITRPSAIELYPWTLAQTKAGQLVYFSSVDDVPNEVDRASFCLSVRVQRDRSPPCRRAKPGRGNIRDVRAEVMVTWNLGPAASSFERLRRVLARRQADESLRAALVQVSRLRDQLQAENVYLRREVRERLGHGPRRRRERRHPPRAGTGASRWPRPIRRCCCSARPAPARSCSRADPRAERAARPGDGARQLRGDSGDADRERAVRPREGRLHRRARTADRALRAGRPLDDLPRRDRRPAVRGAGQAAARARGAADRAARGARRRSTSTCGSSPRPTAISSS